MAKGAWATLAAVATDNCGTTQASPGAAVAGRSRKLADTARNLLNLPCVDVSPIDLILCYERCRGVPGARERVAVSAVEVRIDCLENRG